MIFIDGNKYNRSAFFAVLEFLYASTCGLSVVCFFCAVWAFISNLVGSFILPSPFIVFKAALNILQNAKDFDLYISLVRLAIGSTVSIFLGIILGILSFQFKTFLIFIKPIVSILLGVAPIIWIVLALFWFGFGDISVIFTVIIVGFPLTFGATLTSLNAIPEDIKNMLSVYKLRLLSKIFKVYLPYFLSGVLPSILIAFASSLKLTIMAELLGSSDGVGAKIATARIYLETEQVLAMVSISVAFIVLFDFLIIKPLEIIINQYKKN